MSEVKNDEKFDIIYPIIPSSNVLPIDQKTIITPNNQLVYNNDTYKTNQIKPLPPIKQSNKTFSIKNRRKKKKKIIIITSLIVACVAILAIIGIVVGVVVSENKKINKTNSSTCGYAYVGKYCDECGIRFTSNKIVGGQDAPEHSWPFIVLIKFKYSFYYKRFGVTYIGTSSSTCGGTLVSRDTVVTAAHCYVTTVYHSQAGIVNVEINAFHPTIGSMYTVYLGLNNITEVKNSLNITVGQKMSVTTFNKHPDYNGYDQMNDIAIVKLDREVTLNNNVQIAYQIHQIESIQVVVI